MAINKEARKVYCGGCKYLREYIHPIEKGNFMFGKQCTFDKKFFNTWREVGVEYRNPEVINKNNDCKNYKRKWGLFWR